MILILAAVLPINECPHDRDLCGPLAMQNVKQVWENVAASAPGR
jgi:hypothetical protein